jgi:hypothetical protein
MLALAFLVLAVIAAEVMSPYNKLQGRKSGDSLPMTSLGDRPVLQIELARQESDLKCVLKSGDWMRNVRDAWTGNQLDTFPLSEAFRRSIR